MEITIRKMEETDYDAVYDIYVEGIETENATYETAPPANWESWIGSKINSCSLVAVGDEKILGWAALSPVSKRNVFRGVAEVSIYIANEAKGNRVGSKLLDALIDVSEKNNFWTLQSGIFPDNDVSLHLHYEHGFVKVGNREKMGQMPYGKRKGEWRDVVILERRSKVVGV